MAAPAPQASQRDTATGSPTAQLPPTHPNGPPGPQRGWICRGLSRVHAKGPLPGKLLSLMGKEGPGPVLRAHSGGQAPCLSPFLLPFLTAPHPRVLRGHRHSLPAGFGAGGPRAAWWLPGAGALRKPEEDKGKTSASTGELTASPRKAIPGGAALQKGTQQRTSRCSRPRGAEPCRAWTHLRVLQLQRSLFQLDIPQILIRLTKSRLCSSYISTNTAVATCIDHEGIWGPVPAG